MEVRLLSLNDASYFAEAVELFNRTQGRDLVGPTFIQDTIHNPKARMYGAFENKQLLGVAKAMLLDNYEYYIPLQADICEEFKNLKVGSFSTMSVTENMQGKGVGQALSRLRLEWLQSEGCDVIVGVSWVSGLKHTSNRAFEKMGFKPGTLVKNFYYQSSLEKPFICPGCDSPPCSCSAILYKLYLK